MCTLDDFLSSKVRFIHTSTVFYTESHSYPGKNYSYASRTSFSICLSHGYLPPDMITTTIVYIVKNKCGNISESNYQPIALATIISKLF